MSLRPGPRAAAGEPAQRGVALVLNPGCDLDSSRKAVSYAAAYPHVYAAVGIHPENCAGFVPADIDVLRELARQPKVAAIGEIGLDYYWAENPPRELQQQVLRAQLALARALRLPVIFHDREAHGDSLAIVREFPDVTGVFHCFSGSPEMARELLDLGWYLASTALWTYKTARRAPEVAAVTPLDRMLIETDSPYMTPVPHRGERNDSAYGPPGGGEAGGVEGRSRGAAGPRHTGKRQASVPHIRIKRAPDPAGQALCSVP